MKNTNRPGVAAFELSLSLPLLFTMIILITWQGLSMIGLSDVTIAARHDAWQKRFDDPPGTPLIFLRGEILKEAKLVDNDIVVGEAETSHKISPVVEQMPTPKSQLLLVAGSWDHRQLPLENIPNWRVHGLMAASAKLGGVQSNIAHIQNLLGKIENIGNSVESWQDELGDSLDDDFDKINGGKSDEERRARTDLQKRLDQVNGRIDGLEVELEETNQRIKDLWPDFDEENDGQPPPQSDEDEQGQQNTGTELRLLLNTRARIKTQLRAAEREKRAIEEEIRELDD
jgi:hypothetical protein